MKMKKIIKFEDMMEGDVLEEIGTKNRYPIQAIYPAEFCNIIGGKRIQLNNGSIIIVPNEKQRIYRLVDVPTSLKIDSTLLSIDSDLDLN